MVRAKKWLSQNFLVDPNLQRKIVEAIDPHTDDEVLEVGPGTGALTRLVAPRVRRLVVIELDRQLAAALEEEYAATEHVRVVCGDILDTDLHALGLDLEHAKVLGNLPYHITTPLLFRLLEREHRPDRLVLMVQREVANRILAPAGSAEYGALSVGVRSIARVERLFHVGPRAFRPVPGVDSTVLRIVPIRPAPLDARDEDDLRALTRAAFGWRRKQLQTTLRLSPDFRLDDDALRAVSHETGLDLQRRPETLAPDEFIRLARALRTHAVPRADARRS